MRGENISDWADDKVAWKCRDRRNNVTPKRGDVLQQRYWVFHLWLKGDVVET